MWNVGHQLKRSYMSPECTGNRARLSLRLKFLPRQQLDLLGSKVTLLVFNVTYSPVTVSGITTVIGIARGKESMFHCRHCLLSGWCLSWEDQVLGTGLNSLCVISHQIPLTVLWCRLPLFFQMKKLRLYEDILKIIQLLSSKGRIWNQPPVTAAPENLEDDGRKWDSPSSNLYGLNNSDWSCLTPVTLEATLQSYFKLFQRVKTGIPTYFFLPYQKYLLSTWKYIFRVKSMTFI